MHYIILDLEATCWEGRRDMQNEIIEIGAVKLDRQYEPMDEFCEFVKPFVHPHLSDFCRQLTSIRQKDVDGADHYPAVIGRFIEWIGPQPYYLCSWGFYDRRQFIEDCELHGVSTDWIRGNHISVKHQHGKFFPDKKPMGLGRAIQKEGFSFEGTAHRGIDDARNIVKIFRKHKGRWNFDVAR